MQSIQLVREGDKLTIGQEPQLIVNLTTQENYIRVDQQMIPYRKCVELSEDLLAGKRKHVFATALNYYYQQACRVAEGIAAAKQYRSAANTTVREK